MSLSSASSSIFRRSYLPWDDSSSFSSPDTNETTPSRSFSYLRNSSPSSSSSRGSIYESAPRSRTSSKESRKRRDSGAAQLSSRMSFMDLGEQSSSRLFGTLKGRMHRKRSAPLLGSSRRTTPVNEPSASTSTSSLELGASRNPIRATRDDSDIPRNVDTNDLPNFRDERKHTIMPEEVVGGVGYGIRASRLSTVPESETGEDVDLSKAGYRLLPFRTRDGMVLHSYKRSDAPFMRSYNKVDLQTDAYFHQLLRRLNTTGTASFHEYLSPPEDVLDLGCGQGTWAQEAANSWPSAKVVGYDLVDLISDCEKFNSNITWKRGNFVAYRLPFGPGSFDLVRLANLTEAVPLHRWERVLVEVRRVLKPAGRIEIIDDEIVFPYARPSSKASSSRASGSRDARNSWGSNKSNLPSDVVECSDQPINASFLDFDSFADRRSIGSAPSLCREDSPSEESTDCLQTPVDEFGGLSMLLQSKARPTTPNNPLSSLPLCHEIEEIYRRMLETMYDINTRPRDFLESLLRKVFGPAGKVNMLRDFQLSLLNPEMHDLVVTSKHADPNLDSPRRARKLFKADRDGKRIDKNKEILDKVIISQSKSKALRVLGASGDPTPASNPISTTASDESDLCEEQTATYPTTRSRALSGISALAFPTSSRPSTSSSVTSRPKSNNHPAGVFVSPDRFLETTPFELERYLCKHIDTLLGCKAALDEYVLSMRDVNGEPIVQEDEWHDMLWEYERVRRDRFGLPNAGGSLDDTEDEEDDITILLKEPVRHPRIIIQPVAAAINNQAHTRTSPSDSPDTVQSFIPVRRIRVIEAFRIKPSLPS